jgi:hypothetical protein
MCCEFESHRRYWREEVSGLDVDTYKLNGVVNEVIVTHSDTVDQGVRVRLTDIGLIVEQWRNLDERLDILGDERLRD